MTAAVNQDFTTFAGDAIAPVFAVVNAAGGAVDISAVSDIRWTCRRNAAGPIILTKTKIASQIAFVNTGTDGQFQVNLLPTDTTGLSGYYVHSAQIIDGAGNPTTVATGRMRVGQEPLWTYDPTQIGANPLYQVRVLIGDTVQTDQQLQDGEILYFLTLRPTAYGAAAECCRALAAQYSRSADYAAGMTSVKYSDMAKGYAARAAEFDAKAALSGAGLPYAGGISVADKRRNEASTDRLAPAFTIGMHDNFIPGGPVGTETLDTASGGV
jgi:hypothetical protein